MEHLFWVEAAAIVVLIVLFAVRAFHRSASADDESKELARNLGLDVEE